MPNQSVRDNFPKVLKKFFTADTLPPFIIGAVFLSIVGNSATQLLFNTFGSGTLSVLGIGLGAVLIFSLSLWLIAQKLSRPTLEVSQQRTAPPSKKGLILLVSRSEPCEKAIEYHINTLKKCWLICSDKSLNEANAIREKLERQGITAEISNPIDDVHDLREFYHEVKSIYGKIPAQWNVDDVIGDFTGMTASASVGMVLACMDVGGELEYTPEGLDSTGNRISLEPIAATHRDLQLPQSPKA